MSVSAVNSFRVVCLSFSVDGAPSFCTYSNLRESIVNVTGPYNPISYMRSDQIKY